MSGTGLFPTLCIRADASALIGLGHVMRCLALAQEWRHIGGAVRFITSRPGDALRERIDHEGIAITMLDAQPAGNEDIEESARTVRAEGGRWLVLDGYHFGKDYRAGIKAAGLQSLVLDDLADTDLSDADIVLNQNAYASPTLYADTAPLARLLLGAEHALLRREFLPWRTQRSAASLARNILVTLGGADPGNVTQRIIERLGAFRAWRLAVTVVVGAANPNIEKLRSAVSSLRLNHDGELAVNPPDLAGRMSRADLAVTAAGSTCWELAYLGVPMLAIAIADNQKRVAQEIARLGMAELIDSDAETSAWLEKFARLATSSEQRAAMTTHSRALVDGQGARRVAEALVTHPITLRPALESDAGLLWQWANDPVTRQVSFSTDAIPWENHLRWLTRVLADAERRMFIGQIYGEDIGQVRFDRNGQDATVSIGLAPAWRGRGLGVKLIRSATMRILLDCWAERVIALVKSENTVSLSAFERAGYRQSTPVEIAGRSAVHLELKLKSILVDPGLKPAT